MKILFLSYDGMTDPLGQSQVIPYLQGLSAAGHKVWLISFEKPERYSSGRDRIQTLLNSTGIKWLPQQYTSKPPVISTVRDVRTMRKVAYSLIEKEQIEVLHCRSYISALVGQSAKKRFKTKFIFDMRGFWADERVDGGLWKLSNPLFKSIYNFFKKKEKQYLREANATVSLTQNAADEIHSWKGFEQVPITVIPCCADLDLYVRPSDTDIQHMRRSLGIQPGAFVLSYLGSLGTWYMLPEMMRFFKVLLQSKPEAVFLFITADEPAMVRNEALQQGVPEHRCIVRKAARNEVPVMASVSDVSIFFIKPLFSKKASSPTKMGELMSLGIPLICNDNVGDVEAILRDGGNGVLLSRFDDAAYAKAVSELDAVLQADPQLNMKCALKHYSLQDGVKRYLGVYEKL